MVNTEKNKTLQNKNLKASLHYLQEVNN